MPPRRLETWRVKSPWRLSTLMTSAPWSARSMVADGPETTLVRSIMRIPCNGPGMGLPVLLVRAYLFPGRPFVPDATVLDRGLTQEPPLRGHDVAVAVFQLEAAVTQSEHGHVGIGAGLQRADRALVAH